MAKRPRQVWRNRSFTAMQFVAEPNQACGQHGAHLEGSAHGNDLVGVDAAVGVLAEDLAHDLLDARHTRLPAHQQHLQRPPGKLVCVASFAT